MKQVYLIRHAKSCWEDPSLGDKERPLNPRGHRDAPFMANYLAKMKVKPDLIISSTAKRTQTTANYFAKQFEILEEEIMYDNDLYDASVDDVFSTIRSLPSDKNVVFLFGHNPSITYMSNMFGGDRIDNVPTCGIVRIEFSGDDWGSFDVKNSRQIFFIAPKLIEN